MFHKEFIKEKLNELLNIPSPTGDTKKAINWCKDEFEKLGANTWFTPKGALGVTFKGENDEKQRLISAHVDTLGAMVKEIKGSGRLKLVPIGGMGWTSVDGEYCTISTLDGREYRGTILFEKTSPHTYGDAPATTKRSGDNMEIRLDERVSSKKDVEGLGIAVGDFIYLDPRVEITESGYIKSRHLDDKACVVTLLEVARIIKENNIKLTHTTHFMVTNFEEVGHGASGGLPEKVLEMIGLDMACPGVGQESEETHVTICAKDSSGPYDLELRRRLTLLSRENDIDYRVDIYNHYGSDVSAALRGGNQIIHGLIGPGVDASHAFERTHICGLINTAKLVLAYLEN